MEGQWKFRPFEKFHDAEGGFGYWIEGFSGELTFVEYEKEITEEGYYLTHIDGNRVFYPNPTEENSLESTTEVDTFDPEAAV